MIGNLDHAKIKIAASEMLNSLTHCPDGKAMLQTEVEKWQCG